MAGDYSADLESSFNKSNILITFEELPSELNNLSDVGSDVDRIRNQNQSWDFQITRK